MQYGWALKYPNSNVAVRWAREFPDYKKMFGEQFIYRSPYKQFTWSIYIKVVINNFALFQSL